MLFIALFATLILKSLVKELRDYPRPRNDDEPFYDSFTYTEQQHRAEQRQRDFVEHNTSAIKRKFGPMGEHLGKD